MSAARHWLAKAWYRSQWTMSWLRWGRRLGRYPVNSMLRHPEFLRSPEGIWVGEMALIWPHARLECVDGGRIVIQDRCCIHPYFHCGAAELVTIGEDTVIASRVYITDHDHTMPVTLGKYVVRPVHIGRGCWLGEGCAILKGVTLGDGCVVGANAVVTKSAPKNSVLVGVPARVIKTLPDHPTESDLAATTGENDALVTPARS